MTQWEVGDKAFILSDKEFERAPNGIYRAGEVHTVNYVTCAGLITFEGDNSRIGWSSLDWFEPVDEDDCGNDHDPVHNPAHYNGHPSGIECIQVIEHMGFNLGNAIKYIWRADLKHNAVEDLQKAAWYLNREIEKRKK